jgi:wyosine [tRNA(Phe)-imidazoG37] synthetase (radical SAM superfamily)
MNTLQAQRSIQEVVFGPYISGRFGRSLGINPLPQGARLCNFDCIYCECAGPIDNTGPREVAAWTECLTQLAPRAVQIYSLDRLPAKPWVRQASRVELESIARYVESTAGIPAHVV